MDYAEEQEMELQALEAIYGDDFKKLEGSEFEVVLVPEAGAGEDVNHVSVAMQITYSETYPEAAPAQIKLRAVRRGALTDELMSECEELLRTAASSDECLGTAMVYLLAEKCIEWLVEHNQPELDMHQQMMQRLELEKKQQQQASGEHGDAVDVGDDAGSGGGASRKKKKAEVGDGTGNAWRRDPDAAFDPAAEAARKGETWTPVTVESFAEWRKEWEAERAAAAAAASGGGGTTAGGGGGKRNVDVATHGLTGRQLFAEGGASLLATDAGDLEEGEEDIMSAPREAAQAGNGAASTQAAGGASAVGVLDAVGDDTLFDEEDLDDLPDDE
jgi:hypothetical protein